MSDQENKLFGVQVCLWWKYIVPFDCGWTFCQHEGWLTMFVFCSPGIESSLESQTDMEASGQQSDDPSLPSTSQEPGNLSCY